MVEELKRGRGPRHEDWRTLLKSVDLFSLDLFSQCFRVNLPTKRGRGQRLNYVRGRGLGRGRGVGVDLGDGVAVGVGLGVPLAQRNCARRFAQERD